MKASETQFQSIIEGTKQYVVPLFQRPYSWDKKEWEVLWEDIIWLCQNEEPKSHFIGSIVTMPTISVPEGVAKYLLIDGQQRLTTIFILMTLLRDVARRSDESDTAQEVEQTMLVNPFKKGGDYFKLLPTQIDRGAFRTLIQGTEPPSESRMSQCYQFFERKFRQSQIDVKALTNVISTRLTLVSIVLGHDDNPHLVFESLNAKGRRLTQSDLIRNYFFMRIHVDEQETTHAKYWEPMQLALNEDLTESIRHYLMRNGSIVKQDEVYFTLKDRIGHGDALKSLQEIATFAGYYRRFLSPEHEPEPRLQQALYRLRRLEVTTAYPFLLNCYHEYAQNKITVEDLVRVLQILENYVIRRFVCNIPSSPLNKIFPVLYQQAQARNPSNWVDGVRLVLQSRDYPKDIEFHTRLIDAKLYGAGERLAKATLILQTLESAYQHKEQPPYINATIEHVMPQTLTDWWQHHLGDEANDYELFLHTLGNLTLTGYNSELSNDSFPKKKQHFANSHFELNRYFQHVTSWRRADIEARSESLADLAISVWPYFGEEQADVPASLSTVTGRTPTTITILGQRMSVATWRDVQTQTLDTIAELEPELFTQLAVEYPRFISTEVAAFRRKRQLSNGYYIEVNLSARDVYRFCTQAIESIGLSSEDWVLETV